MKLRLGFVGPKRIFTYLFGKLLEWWVTRAERKAQRDIEWMAHFVDYGRGDGEPYGLSEKESDKK